MFGNYKCLCVALLTAFLLVNCKEKRKLESDPIVSDSIITTDTSTAGHVAEEANNYYAEIDISPMDMSYYPPNYPQHKMADPGIAPPIMRIIYSRPHLQGRKLFEGIIKYGNTWRLGANEATELNTFIPVKIGDKKIPAGRYTLYTIPKAGYWTIVVNANIDEWGLKQDTSKDLVRVQVPVTYYNPVMEYFTMVFEKTTSGANLVILWDDVIAKLPVTF